MSQKTAHHNLLVEEWIPVLWVDGTPCRVGIRTALTEAGHIRQIAASNPMDNVALLRFLLAVLQWCKPELSDHERAQPEGAEGIPEECLDERLRPANAPNPVFNLLGDGPRFYQDASLRPGCSRPVGDLLQEFPT